MSDDKHFFDTNILVYTFDHGAPAKAAHAQDLIYRALGSGKGIISYQVVQEFVSVARNRFERPLPFGEIEKYWETTLRPLLAVHSSPALFMAAMNLARMFQLASYDALIVAAAIQGRCTILYSEDLQHGQRFGDLVVENPFQ